MTQQSPLSADEKLFAVMFSLLLVGLAMTTVAVVLLAGWVVAVLLWGVLLAAVGFTGCQSSTR